MTAKTAPRWFGLVFAGFAALFIVAGASLALAQARTLARAQPTPGVVVESGVERHAGEDGDTWSPRVVFRYAAGAVGEAEAAERTADAVLPLEVSAGRAWADSIAARHPVGASVTVWVDPEDPGKAFLVHAPEFFPYLFILFPMLHAAVGIGIVVGSRHGARSALRAVALAWWTVGIAAFAHWIAIGGGWSAEAPWAALIYGAIGLALLAAWRKARPRADAAPSLADARSA